MRCACNINNKNSRAKAICMRQLYKQNSFTYILTSAIAFSEEGSKRLFSLFKIYCVQWFLDFLTDRSISIAIPREKPKCILCPNLKTLTFVTLSQLSYRLYFSIFKKIQTFIIFWLVLTFV